MYLNEHDKRYCETRYQQALWYLWGRQDADPTLHHIDGYHFAEFCRLQAAEYRCERRTSLACIRDQLTEFLTPTVEV